MYLIQPLCSEIESLGLTHVCYLTPLLLVGFPYLIPPSFGGKWILPLLPVSCMRSSQNRQAARFVTGGGHRFLIMLLPA